MASDAISTVQPVSRLPRAIVDLLIARPAATALLFALVLWQIHPIGFVGGGGDEYHYLIAARCGAEHGICLPVDHWWRRWPLVLPTSGTLRLLGESAATLMIVPFVYALACVAMLSVLIARQFGRVAGCLGGIVFAFTPIVSELSSQLGVDLPELAFVLAALLFVQAGLKRNGRAMFALAGLAAGMAIQTRPTALVLLPAIAGLLLVLRPGAIAIYLLMATLPSVLEASVYGALYGDPMLGWRLSLSHGRIPSSELSSVVDTSRSPLLNPDFIAGWRRPMGLQLHWSIDGLLNLVFNPAVAITLCACGALLALDRRRLRGSDPQARALVFAGALATTWFVVLTYVLAVDPKPRMFLVPLACASAILAALLARRWPGSRVLVVAIMTLIIAKGLIAAVSRTNIRHFEAAAPTLIAAAGPALAIHPRTAEFLALVPQAARLPRSVGPADRRPMLVLGFENCRHAATEEGYPGWGPIDGIQQARADTGPFAIPRRAGLFVASAPRPVLCVLTPP